MSDHPIRPSAPRLQSWGPTGEPARGPSDERPPTRGPSDERPPTRPTVVVVSGLSGAGKSQALHALEDLGFFCVDNLPTLLAPQAVALCERGEMTRVALGIDVRVRAFLGEVGNVLQLLEAGGQRDLHVLFLDASDETLLRRFSETRRPHPLAAEAGASGSEGALAVLDGVRVERERLAPLRARATRVIDTTNTSVHELRRILVAHFGPASGDAPRMVTRIVSFGFKYGTPVDADLVLDVRFLDNPYFVPDLKPMTGLDPARRVVRPRCGGHARVLAPHARPPRVRGAPLRARGEELPDHRHRLHRGQASVGGDRRGAGEGPLGDRGRVDPRPSS